MSRPGDEDAHWSFTRPSSTMNTGDWQPPSTMAGRQAARPHPAPTGHSGRPGATTSRQRFWQLQHGEDDLLLDEFTQPTATGPQAPAGGPHQPSPQQPSPQQAAGQQPGRQPRALGAPIDSPLARSLQRARPQYVRPQNARRPSGPASVSRRSALLGMAVAIGLPMVTWVTGHDDSSGSSSSVETHASTDAATSDTDTSGTDTSGGADSLQLDFATVVVPAGWSVLNSAASEATLTDENGNTLVVRATDEGTTPTSTTCVQALLDAGSEGTPVKLGKAPVIAGATHTAGYSGVAATIPMRAWAGTLPDARTVLLLGTAGGTSATQIDAVMRYVGAHLG